MFGDSDSPFRADSDLVWTIYLVFTRVYGPTKRVFREELWEDLGAIRGMWGDPWCIRGNFNIIRFPREWNRDDRILGVHKKIFLGDR